VRPTSKNRIPAAQRQWLSRADIVAEWPISYCTLASIPQSLLPRADIGKSAAYDRADVEALFAKLKGRSLADLVREASASQATNRRRGRPRQEAARDTGDAR